MSNDATRRWAQKQQKRSKNEDRPSDAGYAICLHCNNPFPIGAGVVTPAAAICDVCNDD